MTTPETRPYFEAFEKMLSELQGHDVKSVCMVALCTDGDTHDVITCYNAGPFEMVTAAGALQLHASYKFNQINANEEEGEEE